MVCNVVHSFGSGIYSMSCGSFECVGSLADRVGFFPQSCFQKAGEQSQLDESSHSIWEEFKKKVSVCVDSCLSALTHNPFSIDLASEELRRDPEMILAVLPRDPGTLHVELNQPNSLIANGEFMMRAVAFSWDCPSICF
ncbi:MAG: hypothetical protein EB051_00690 [Chlamydiia bacterium]|nr:hypothetical protein [Chlamydiia bacterium]